MPRAAALVWGMVAVLLVVPVLTDHFQVGALPMRVLVTLLLVSAVYSISSTRRTLVIGAGLAAATAVFSLAMALHPAAWLVLVNLLLGAAFYFYAAIALLLHVQHSRRVTADTLYSSVASYQLLGLGFAALYLTTEHLFPGSIKGVLHEQPPLPFSFLDAMYFSMVTLTTAGFGDISPVSSLARSLAVIETVIGVLFPAILMSRLVGLYLIHQEVGVEARNPPAEESSHAHHFAGPDPASGDPESLP
ncbi:MAG: ion channel [Candidatus Eremiobacterota bacterium]